jgi:hypothetical protein
MTLIGVAMRTHATVEKMATATMPRPSSMRLSHKASSGSRGVARLGKAMTHPARDRAEQRAITRKIVAREHDQVLRMWMPFDAGFALWQPYMRNVGQLDLRGNFGYGSSTLARLWLDR